MPPEKDLYDTRTAVLAIMVSVAALSLGDAVIKATSLTLPLWQMYILRSAVSLPVLWWLARRRGPLVLIAPFWVIARSALLVLMWLSYYSALPLMPLSLAAAVYYTGPLLIVGLAACVARQLPTGRAIFAIGCGFLGVLMAIRPDTSGFTVGALLALAAAFLYACAMVLTAAKCREDDPFVLALMLNVAFVVVGAILGVFSGNQGSFIFGSWQPLDLRLLGTVALLAVLILIGSTGAALAYQKGPPTTVAAFDYSYLVFSLIWGSLFFAELPDSIALMGIVIIIASGLLALPRRESQSEPT